MEDQLSMFDRATSEGTPNAISLPASRVGHSPSKWRGGPNKEKYGPHHAHVSRFRARENKGAMPTNDTSGPLFNHSSPSATLQRSLESRLRVEMGASGSLQYGLTPKARDHIGVSQRSIHAPRDALPNAVAVAMGAKTTQETRDIGTLNPAWVAWLMGFPKKWDACAPMETP